MKAAVLMASGIYFFARYRRQGPVFWISVILFTTGFFDLRFQLELWMESRSLSDMAHRIVLSAIHLMFFGANTLYHCFVLLFYLEVTGHAKKFAYVLVFLPPLVVLLFFTSLYPDLEFDFRYAALLGGVYWLISFAMFLVCMIKDRTLDMRLYHVAIALMLLSNGMVLVFAHTQGKEFVELVNMPLFTLFLALCLVLLLWVNMKKVLVGLQREAVVQKMDMSTALLHHSFKNAIGKVKINAWNIRNSLAQQPGLTEQGRQEIEGYVQNLFSTYSHMMGMMDKISQIVRNKVDVRPETIDLAILLEEAAEAAAAYPGVKVVRQLDPAPAEADRAHTLECLHNLIQNAIDAMHGEGTLTLITGKQGRFAFVTVRDTGTGMDREQLSQAFEPFYSTKRKSGKNMGLGLYYVRKVMEAHKGKVTIESLAGKGTTVTLQFRQGRSRHGKNQSVAG